MLIERNLGWLFYIQKYIFLPNYQIPRSKRRLAILSFRFVPIICLNIYAMYNIFHHIVAKDLSYFGGKSTVSSLMSRFDMISIKFGVVFITILALLKNHQHLHLLGMYQVFEKKFTEFFEVPSEKFISVLGNIVMVVIIVYNFISNTVFHLFFISMDGYTFIWYFFHMCNILLDDITIFYILGIIHLVSNFMFLFENDPIVPHDVEIFNIFGTYLEVIERINSTFGLTIAYIFIRHFFEAWCSLYFALTMAFWHKWNLTILLCFIIWATRSISIVIITAFVCQRCSEKTRAVTKSLGRIYENYCGRRYMDFHERSIQFNAQQFLLQHLHHETKISAGVLFTINASLVSAIFSSIATYLVILLQFEQLEEFLKFSKQ
uniref:Gustatory receptor n=1 Tax=Lutzomyia longipalpis TaxID=7200 RepID=A0A3F2ZDA0_LUTLO